MGKTFALAAVIGATTLAGCTQGINPTDVDRAAIGAAAGAGLAAIGDRDESDIYKAAAIGGAAGALCNDARLCE